MKVRCLSLLAFVMVMAGSSYTFANVSEHLPGQLKPEFHAPHEVIEIYFKAVNRGELIVFDRKLEKSMLIPVRVEYVYELSSVIPLVKVYSKLKEPLSVPGQESCKLLGVSAILNDEGSIIETEAHIWSE